MTTLTPIDRDAAALELAASHREDDPGLRLVRWYTSGPTSDIRLLEVTSEISTTNEVFPIRFKARVDFPFNVVIVLVSPSEFDGIMAGELEMPTGWGTVYTDL